MANDQMELAAIGDKVKTGLQHFEERKALLIELRSKAEGLKITSIDDKESITSVSLIRKSLKSARVEIEKEGKAMRDPLTQISRLVSEKEKELVAIIEPTEKALLAQEKWVDDEKARIEQERVNARLERLKQYGAGLAEEYVKLLSDEDFETVVDRARVAFEAEQKEKAEQEKQRRAKEEQDEKDRQELLELRKKNEEREKELKEQEEKLEKERERLRKEKISARQDHLIRLGFRRHGDAFLYRDITIDQDAIEIVSDADWKDNMVTVVNRINECQKKEEQELKEKREKEQQEMIRTQARIRELLKLGFVFDTQLDTFVFDRLNVPQELIEKYDDSKWESLLLRMQNDVTDLKAQEQARRTAEEWERTNQLKDREKLQIVIDQIKAIQFPDMDSAKARKVVNEAKILLENVVGHITNSIKPVTKTRQTQAA